MVSESEDISVPKGGFWPLDRSLYTLRCRAGLPSSRDSINTAVHMILDVARRCGCDEGKEADLEIALREAVANAVIHGNGSDAERQIFVRAYGSTENALLVLVRDEGPGFEPEGVPDPRSSDRLQLAHGRGLFLMRALMDYVEYRRNGCEVLLFKRW